jgi:hypothetical protein
MGRQLEAHKLKLQISIRYKLIYVGVRYVLSEENPSARLVLSYVAENRLFTIARVLASFSTADEATR